MAAPDAVEEKKNKLGLVWLDEDQAPKFPISGEELKRLSKEFVETQFGCEKLDMLADDFQFRFPVVELDKTKFVKAFSSFKLEDAFPDMKTTYYGFRLDPFQPGRVWWDVRSEGTNTGPFGGPFSYISPTFKKFETPPQVMSMSFNEKGQVTKLTGGYVVDKDIGNTGGLGGVFGIMHAIGKTLPFREAQPYKPSWRYWAAQRIQWVVDTVQSMREGQGKHTE